jgi:hypothetical protein
LAKLEADGVAENASVPPLSVIDDVTPAPSAPPGAANPTIAATAKPTAPLARASTSLSSALEAWFPTYGIDHPLQRLDRTFVEIWALW